MSMNRSSVAVGVVLGVALVTTGTGCMKRYILQSKTAEARANLGVLSREAAAAFDRESMDVLAAGAATPPKHALCKSATKKVPASASDIRGKKYVSQPTEWTSDPPDTGFTCLHFSIESPQYFMYGYSATSDAFAATAEGDLNGDGVLSNYKVTGKVSGNSVIVAPTVEETNPLE